MCRRLNFKRGFISLALMVVGFSFVSCLKVYGKNQGVKYFRNYGPKEYGLQHQNWFVLQDKRGFIYVGNNGGLLEFDGVSWRTIRIPNRTVRSLAKDDTGTIYVGGNNEIGYLAPDENGSLAYLSLGGQLGGKQKKFSDIWKTHATGEGVYFQSNELIFRYNPGSGQINDILAPGVPGGSFFFSFRCRQKLFVRQKEYGLTQVAAGAVRRIPGGETFTDKSIYMMVPYGEDGEKILIGTGTYGFYIYDGQAAVPFPTEADEYIEAKQLYHGIRLSTGDFALATLRGGLLIIDTEGRLKQVFNKSSGLLDENVKHVMEDSQGNLWLALSNGVTKIEYNSPLSIYDNNSGLPGLVRAVVRYRDDLIGGTNYGVYILGPDDKFQLVPGMSKNCWFLLCTGESLLAATSDGVFRIDKSSASRKIIPNNSYFLLPSSKEPDRVWVGTREGLVSIYFNSEDDRWQKEQEIKSINQEIRTIVEDDKGKLWLGTMSRGVLRVDFPDAGTISRTTVKRYHTSHRLPAGEVSVFKAATHVMFASEEGVFRFDEADDCFVPDFSLGEEFADGSRGIFRIVEDVHRDIWFHSRNRNFRAVRQADGSFIIDSIPFLRIPLAQVNTIYPDPVADDIVWLGSDDGLIRFDKTVKKNYNLDFSTFIRQVTVNGILIFKGYPGGINRGTALKQTFATIDYQDRNLRFVYAAPFFEAEAMNRYQCRLEGYEKNWSPWAPETMKDYTNLDSGMYTFRVRARNVYKHVGREAVFRFRVLPPWYKTWWAFLLYALAIFSLVFLIVRWRSGKLEREKQRLERIVRQRTKEINHKNEQLKRQTLQLKEQSKKLKEMDQVKSRFFANISHEFRTPLTLIMAPLEQLLSGRRGRKEKEKLGLILQNAQRLLTLINQLLDLSRLDSGKMKLRAVCQNIVPFLKGLLASFELLAAQNKLSSEFIVEEQDITLYFDVEKMEKLICNLLLNAIKFTPPGGKITVAVRRVRSQAEDFPTGFLEISVQDTGIGIPKEQLAHIFDRFYQASGLREQGYKGTGIGLALVKELIALHCGKIDVHSHEGKGTEFILRLPLGAEHLKPGEIVEDLKEAAVPAVSCKVSAFQELEKGEERDEKADKDEERGEEIEAESQEKTLILIVEDNPDVRKYIKESLVPLYRVVEAADGRRGIQKAKEMIPDLIISDIMMPEADGYELCRVLKNDIHTSHIPIILLTAKASEASIVQGLEAGADDYITKPFNIKILSIRIKNLIDLRRQLQLKIQRRKMLLPAEIAISSMDEAFLKELQDTIAKNLSDPEFNIDKLCQKLLMGRTSLFRKTHALTGETPNQFIQSYRLERAAQLLKANFGNVTEVAFEVGFSSTAYFTRCFKEKFHQLPSTFQASGSS